MNSIVMQCEASGVSFEVSNRDRERYATWGIPTPRLCPAERQRRRLAWRNERSLHWRTCSITEKKILSIYHPSCSFPVYDVAHWWSDGWSPEDYARDFDFSRGFFEQFLELQNDVPHPALNVTKSTIENSDFCNQVTSVKDCYLIYDSRFSERCMYGKTIERSFDCVDCFKAFDCEGCYEVVDARNCFFCHYVLSCTNCSECMFSSNLIGCSNCFGCTNLRNKSYYFFNKSLSKEEWERRVNESLQEYSEEELWQVCREYFFQHPKRASEQLNCEDSTGEYLFNCSHCHECYDCEYFEHSSYCFDVKADRDAAVCSNNYDITHFGGRTDHCCECVGIGNNAQHILFSENTYSSADVWYSRISPNSSNLFGCVGMRRGSFAIFNKPLGKEEFQRLSQKILEHMRETEELGEFFPISMSPFAYNETVAQDYFPMTRDETTAQGWKWRDDDRTTPPTAVMSSQIDAANDAAVLDAIFRCEKSDRPYRIIRRELEFYRKHELSLPRLSPEERLRRRIALKRPRQQLSRTCSQCSTAIQTSLTPEDEPSVLCEDCFLNIVED